MSERGKVVSLRTSPGWCSAADPTFLPYGRQTIESDDIAAVANVLTGDLLTTGPLVDRFEAALAARTGARHAVACSNGTAALHMALKAAGLEQDEVCIVPAITFVATANAVRYEGADVIFADVDPATGLMTEATLAQALERAGGRRVRAVLPVHLCGNPVEMPAIRRLASEAGAVIIEDACHALGTETPWGPVGSGAHSAMTCFSFHPVKTICTGEGGAVTTNDPALDQALRRIRNHGATRDAAEFSLTDEAFTDGQPNSWWYEQVDLGWNYRLTDIACALGISQLSKLDRFLNRRRELAALYERALKPLEGVVATVPIPEGALPGLHLFVARIDFDALGKSRKAVMDGLRARGVGTQVHYIPVWRQPYYRGLYGEQDLPGADRWYQTVLSLPLYPLMKDEDPGRVARALSEVLLG